MQKHYKYLLIGTGRLATHLSFYFDNQKIDYLKWNRNSNISFDMVLQKADIILIAISDDAIESFINVFLKNSKNKIIVHFSGNLSLQGIESTHPLMTFGDKFYSEEFYETIPFITEKGKCSFSEIFPELPNPNYQINQEDKSLYHAWCSIAGNFTTLLWKTFENRLTNNFSIPREVMIPYLNKITENIIGSKNPLTGPFARKDFAVIEKHKQALENDLFLGIYNKFYDYYFNNNEKDEAHCEDC